MDFASCRPYHMDNMLWHDLRLSLRRLVKNPVANAAICLSLALGTGMTSAIFNIIKAVFVDSLSTLERPDELITLNGSDTTTPGGVLPISYANYEDLRAHNRDSMDLAVFHYNRINLVDGEIPQRVFAQTVSRHYFDLLGVPAALGRVFHAEQDVAESDPVVVLNHSLWTSRYGADPAILGHQMRLNGQLFTVIGVTPAGFKGTATFNGPDLWVPIDNFVQLYGTDAPLRDRSLRALSVFGRRAPGMSMAQAEASLRVATSRLVQDHAAINENRRFDLQPLTETAINPQIRHLFVRGSWMVLGLSSLLLVIACVNMASLLLARANTRKRDMAVRLALGAGRGAIVRQQLVESVVLTGLGGALGLVVAFVLPTYLWRFRPSFMTDDALALGVDSGVVLFSILVALGTGVIFGLIPALGAARAELVSVIKDQATSPIGANRWYSWRHFVLLFQVGLCVVSLVAAGLFLRSWSNAQALDLGFDPDHLVIMTFDTGAQGLDEVSGRQFLQRLAADVESNPAIEKVVFSSNRPLNRGALYTQVATETLARDESPLVRLNTVWSGYFETLDIDLVAGRTFTDADRADAEPVVVINQALAELLYGEGDALGRAIDLDLGTDTEHRVVGVVANNKYIMVTEEHMPCAFLSTLQYVSPTVTLYAATRSAPEPLVQPVRQAVQRLDPLLPISEVRTLRQEVDRRLWAPRLGASLLAVIGVLALVLAIIGTYGTVAYSVSQRRWEISLRMAMGANRWKVLRMLLRQAMTPVGIGIMLGTVAAAFVGRAMAGLLFGLSGTDPIVFITVGLLLAVTALAATLLGSRQAMSVEPASVLRER